MKDIIKKMDWIEKEKEINIIIETKQNLRRKSSCA